MNGARFVGLGRVDKATPDVAGTLTFGVGDDAATGWVELDFVVALVPASATATTLTVATVATVTTVATLRKRNLIATPLGRGN